MKGRLAVASGVALVAAVAYGAGLPPGLVSLGVRRAYPELPHVSPARLERWRAGGEVEVLDVRTRAEFEVSHLDGARWVGEAAGLWREIAVTSTVVVVCALGVRSAAVADRLAERTERRVYNLDGGVFRWAREGRRLVGGPGVHPFGPLWGLFLPWALRQNRAEGPVNPGDTSGSGDPTPPTGTPPTRAVPTPPAGRSPREG